MTDEQTQTPDEAPKTDEQTAPAEPAKTEDEGDDSDDEDGKGSGDVAHARTIARLEAIEARVDALEDLIDSAALEVGPNALTETFMRHRAKARKLSGG